MNDLPRFTVIVLSYRNERYHKVCLDSVTSQDYPDVEIVFIDDGTPGFDPEKTRRYLETDRRPNLKNIVVLQNGGNEGTVRSINRAIGHSSGEYIKLLAGDDALYDEHVLSTAAGFLKDVPDGFLTGDVLKCDGDLRPVGKYRKALPEKLDRLTPKQVFRRLAVHDDIVAGGVFLRRDFFTRYGLFDENYRLAEDWPKWMEVTKKGCRFRHAPFYAIRYRADGGVGTSVNPYYLADKRRVLDEYVIGCKKDLGLWYPVARVSYALHNSLFIRRLYGRIFRRGV